MSGGSFNYLCWSTGEGLFKQQSDLKDMVAALNDLGAEDAAKETRDLLVAIETISKRLDAKVERLSAVWKAVEWMQSGDWDQEELNTALRQYRGEG